MPSKSKAIERTTRNDDITDRELLGVISDVAASDPDGYASTTEIALGLGFSGNGKKSQTPAIKVASRLSWMRAGQLLESTGPNKSVPNTEPGSRDTRWRLSPAGRQILQGALSKAVENAINRMDPGAQVLMMRKLTRQGYVEAAVPIAFAVNREYKHNIAHRQLVLRIGSNAKKK